MEKKGNDMKSIAIRLQNKLPGDNKVLIKVKRIKSGIEVITAETLPPLKVTAVMDNNSRITVTSKPERQ